MVSVFCFVKYFWERSGHMRRFWYRRILIMLVVVTTIFGLYFVLDGNAKVDTGSSGRKYLIPGGMPVGIYLETDGILVLATETLEDISGEMLEPAKNLVRSGDYIVAINEETVENKKELIQKVAHLKGANVVLKIRRNQEYFSVSFQSVEVEPENYKLGIWVKDSSQGLGTITYITSDNQFAALGHGIHDSSSDELVEVSQGRIYNVEIVGIQKGRKGEPGGLEGVIVYSKVNKLGLVESNSTTGIYGTIDEIEKLGCDLEKIEICEKRDIEIGKASILCSIDGEVKAYDVEIKSLDYFVREENKGIVLLNISEQKTNNFSYS